MIEQTDVLVIGGGLAGLAAAAYIAPGRKLTLLEASRDLGGQCVGTWREGRPWDFGVHGIYPRYSELIRLLALTGAPLSNLMPAGDQYVVTPAGRLSRVRMPMLPAPVHCLAHSCLLNVVGPRQRLKLLKGATRLLGVHPDTPGLDDMSLKDFTSRMGIPAEAARVVFEPLAWIGFFLSPERLSASAYLSALRFLILGRSDSWRSQWVPTPNSDSLVRPLVDYIRRHQARIYTGARVEGLLSDGRQVKGVRVAGQDGNAFSIEANWVICAIPPLAAAPLIDTLSGCDSLAASLRRIGSTYVHTFRFWFEPNPPPPLLHGVALTEKAGFVFFVLDEMMPGYKNTGARVIEIQCGPEAVEQGEDALRKWICSILFDGSREPRLFKVESTGPIPYASYATGTAAIRPGVQSPWPNLLFAGDWVDEKQGSWFMERAVTTGRAAAHIVLGDEALKLPSRSLESFGVRAARAAASNLMGGLG